MALERPTIVLVLHGKAIGRGSIVEARRSIGGYKMLHFRKSYEVIGYAYEADLHCLECTSKRFNANANALDFTAIDGEGNETHPVFLGDDTGDHCGDCFTRLDGEDDTPDSTEDDGEDGD